jgi:2-furoate---CoA ligase
VTLARLLELAALRWPAAEAVVDGDRRLTYADLHARARALGGAFRRLGVSPGDRVLIALRNRLEHVLAYWALQTIGGVPTPVNFRFAPTELRYVLDDSGARLALYEAGTAEAMQAAAESRSVRLVFVGSSATPAGSVPFEDLIDEGSHSGGGGAAAPPAPREHDLSLLLYTSGTTGRPKGVPRTHRNHAAGALAQALQCGWTWGERTLGVMPLYHTMGIHALTGVAAVNGCFVCQPEWTAPAALRLIRDERITALYLIPTLFYDLVHARELARDGVESVTRLAYAGAPMLAALTEACVKAFQPQVFVNHYGSTEIYTFSVRGCTRPCASWSLRPSGASAPTRSCRRARRVRSSPASIPTRPSPATGTGPTPTPGRCATGGTSPATWAISTPRASCTWPGAWTT